jgi:hypothetical protein
MRLMAGPHNAELSAAFPRLCSQRRSFGTRTMRSTPHCRMKGFISSVLPALTASIQPPFGRLSIFCEAPRSIAEWASRLARRAILGAARRPTAASPASAVRKAHSARSTISMLVSIHLIVLAMTVLAFMVWWITPRVSQRVRHLARVIGVMGMIFLVLAFAAVFIITPY